VTDDGHVAPGFEAVAAAFSECVDVDAPGAAMAAVVDGELVVDVWRGTASDDGRAWAADTVCVVASGSKGVVAVAMLMLVERGLLDLQARVTHYWPEFGANGKADVRVADIVAHTAGLPGVVAPLSAGDFSDVQKIHKLLATQEPIVPVGTATYHAVTYGWLCDALVRRVDGRSVGTFIADEIAGPLGLDLSIGTPPARAERAAPLRRAPNFAFSAFLGARPPDPRLRFVYSNPPLSLDGQDPGLLAVEVPGANCVATARAMAQLYGCLAAGGKMGDVRLLEPDTIDLGRRQLSVGDDPLSGRLLRFGVGFEINPNPSALGPSPDAFGHTGAGGSSHGAWPSLRTGFSFIVSEMRPEDDVGRARRVLDALHAAVEGRR
jgi:CubicO group peptidase (beta-lactamase class C family)